MVDRFRIQLLAAAIFLAPFASVGLVQVITGRGIGTGVQPAYLPLLMLIILEAARRIREPRVSPTESVVLLALLWTAAAAAMTWTLADMGLAGDRPWAKSAKQLVQWCFFVGAAVAVARTLELPAWRSAERALAGGLIVSVILAVALALRGPGAGALALLDTNHSIASGSDELYLGHSFTGLSRLRGPMPEPLHFGSYLLVAVPLVAASGWIRRGWARLWRIGLATLGAACLLGTWSRGAWLGAAAVGLVLFVVWLRGSFGAVSFRRALLSACMTLLAGLLVFSLVLQVAPWEVFDLLFRRLTQSLAGHDMSNMTRVWSWQVAWQLFVEAPVHGHGWGSYGFLFFQRAGEAASGAHFGWPVPNNLALLLLAESGALGLVLWSATLWPAFSCLLRRDTSQRALVLGAVLAGALVQLATFSQWNLPHLWLLFAAAVAAASTRGGAEPG